MAAALQLTCPMGGAASDYKTWEVEMAMQQLIRDAHSPGPRTGAGPCTSCPSQDGGNTGSQRGFGGSARGGRSSKHKKR